MNDNIKLSIKNLTMQFGGIRALNNVSFDVQKGSIHALIGPNGAGKTTVFNCCTGFYQPTAGDIFFQDNDNWIDILNIVGKPIKFKDVVQPWQALDKFYHKLFSGAYKVSQLGMVRTFQNVRLFKEMTTIENLLVAQHKKLNWNLFAGIIGTNSYKRSEKECISIAYKWLERLGLEKDAQTLAGSLPYGKTRKLELARAMCTDPSLICLDEPAAGLNANETSELCDVINLLREEFGVTVFLIEHDMHLVMRVSDQIVVIDHGEVIAKGTPDSIQKNPKVIEAYLGIED